MTLRLLTVKEAAQALRLSRNGLLRLIARGELRAIRYPGTGKRAAKVVIRESDLLAFLDENGVGNLAGCRERAE
jgi:excisionase family DNA binding protein